MQPLACVIVNLRVPTLIQPDLSAPLFAAMLYDTGPEPVPLAPPVTLIHGELGTALHVHEVDVVVTVNEPEPPDAATDAPPGVRVMSHPVACVIVWTRSPTVIRPVLPDPTFGATS